LGYKGALALNFAVLLRQLWSGKRNAIEPSRLKNLLGSRYHQFAGYAQHDAVEFLDNLLDGLHEVGLISLTCSSMFTGFYCEFNCNSKYFMLPT
jgi:ubiquitin C-terminal hydrolase